MRAEHDIYLDNNASAPLLPSVKRAIADALEFDVGNPGSAHGAGARARALMERARQQVALLAQRQSEDIIFCGSGTEANNFVIKSVLARQGPYGPVVTSEIEHSSVLAACRWLESHGVEIVYVPAHRNGTIDISAVEEALKHRPSLVSIQWVNNETGVIQPVSEVSSLCRQHGVPFHCDATQAFGKLPFSSTTTDIDYLTVSAHKIHGPAGVGALIAREPSSLEPLIHGGDQERRLRAGTENLLGIIGFGAAAEHRQKHFLEAVARMRAVRDQFETALRAQGPDVSVNCVDVARVGNTSNVMFPQVDGAALIAQLDTRRICCSQSSACTNSRPEPSFVLRSMGFTEAEAYSSVRFSFSELNTSEEVDIVATAIREICERVRTACRA